MKLSVSVLLIAGCAGAGNEIDFAQDVGPFDPDKNVVLVLHDEIGNAYRLISASYLIDGETVFFRANDDGWSDLPPELRVVRTFATPGPHKLTVNLVYQPSKLGIFTYVKAFRLKVKSSTEFVAQEGKPTAVHAVVTAKGNLTAQLDERPEVAYHVE